MKDNGPLYLTAINRAKSADVWYARVRMGENTIGNIVKSMATCLKTTKKLTNHSTRKTLVSKLKKSGQARNVIRESKLLGIHGNRRLMTTMKWTKTREKTSCIS